MPSFRESLTSQLTTWYIPFAKACFDELFDGTLASTKTAQPGPTKGPTKGPTPQPPHKAAPPSAKDVVLEKAAAFLLEGEGAPVHPYWPQGQSGITWGVGWDASQQTRAQLDADWGDLPAADRDRLATVLGSANKGEAAHKLLPTVKDITIPKPTSVAQLKSKMVPKYYKQTLGAFPGMTELPDAVQVALISLVYNRGAGMGIKKGQDAATVDADEKKSGHLDKRYEMRRIREDVKAKNIQGIADELRAMERIWAGTKNAKGMKKRRESEAAMVEKGLPVPSSGKKGGPVQP